MPWSASFALVAGPTPHISSTGKSWRNASSVAGSTTTSPSGLATCEAILARCLVPRHADRDGKAELVRTRRRIAAAISAGVPKRCVQPATSAKASSIEIRSTSGVKSPRTLIAASPSRWYSLKCPPTKTRSGQSSRARRPGHAAVDTEGLRFVGRREHHAAADGDRLAPRGTDRASARRRRRRRRGRRGGLWPASPTATSAELSPDSGRDVPILFLGRRPVKRPAARSPPLARRIRTRKENNGCSD